MKKIKVEKITEVICNMVIESNIKIPKDVLLAIEKYSQKESNSLGKQVLDTIIKNHKMAIEKEKPMCQDTGIGVFFLEIGNEVFIDGDLNEAINLGVKKGYDKGYLRKSVVVHPLDRVNTKDNTPGIIHIKYTLGDKLKIKFAPKGGGSENASTVLMLTPSHGYQGVKSEILKFCKDNIAKACPPVIVGIGIGGNFETSALLAKESLFRPIDDTAENHIDRKLEEELLLEINNLYIGPMGFRGDTSALAVKVNSYPCHIASLPVAINLQCHAARHMEVIL